MNSIKQSLQKKLPPGIYQSLRRGRDIIQRTSDLPGLYFHPWRMESKSRLQKFQGVYTGKRCFVIGNGPSLKKTDISLVKDEYTFGMNRVYLAFEEWGFQTTFLVSVNDLVIEQCRDEFQELCIPKFYSWRSRKLLYPDGVPDRYTHFLDTTYKNQTFTHNLGSRFWEGGTVTYICLQLAFCMGFEEVYLIGVDHDFETKGTANKTVVSSGEDRDHFNPEYFGKGFRWQLPDLETSEIAYKLAKKVYQQDGRQILDATIDGKLMVFPKVDYQEIFDQNKKEY
jgi:hypothetical protein